MKLTIQLDENESIADQNSITVAAAVYKLVEELNCSISITRSSIDTVAVAEMLYTQALADARLYDTISENNSDEMS